MLKINTSIATESTLTLALREFEIAEANLTKLEKIWSEIESLIPDHMCFGSDLKHEELVRNYCLILPHLSSIDGFKPSSIPMGLNEIGQSRFDVSEIGEFSLKVSLDEQIFKPGSELREYRFYLLQKRRELTRDTVLSLITTIDKDIENLEDEKLSTPIEDLWEQLNNDARQIDSLLGSSPRPGRWSDLLRHIHFAQQNDLQDIKKMDWPSVKKSLLKSLYDENEPIPSGTVDLSDLVNKKPKGPIGKELNWKSLSSEYFERLIFSLLNTTDHYENALLLTKTNAPDNGRDVSVERVIKDPLAGVSRSRVIVQCKHWLTSSITINDIAELKEQMKLWEPPKVDICIIATSGRFTTSAIQSIERHNQSDSGLKIEMWAESHLESILATRPDLIAEFSLR